MTILQSFGLFPQLPSELRELIWQVALPATRVVSLEANSIYPEDDSDEVHQLLYEKCLHGKSVEDEDTRSIPEKDMRLLVHRTSQGLNGASKRQSQLLHYGFVSSRRTPNIAHVCYHDPVTYRGFGESEPSYTPPSSDLRPLLHVLDNRSIGPQNLVQAQLHKYGFKTSRPLPMIRHVSDQKYYEAQRAVRIDNYGSYGSFPVLMHVCRESRQQAIRSGYVLSFPTQWAPPRTWFNFKTDFLYFSYGMDLECFPEINALDRKRIKRLAVRYNTHEPQENMYRLVKSFGNVEELVIVIRDDFPSQEEEGFLVDCTTAEFQGVTNIWWGYDEDIGMKAYIEANPNGSPFFDYLIKKTEIYITGRLEVLMRRGEQGFKIPKIRCVNMTDEQGKRDLEAFRARYWGERENFPSKEDWDRFLREDIDVKIVARPPSPFDIQYADDLEVHYEQCWDEYYCSY